MKKTQKLTKKQLALKKQRQNYITAALLATAIVLVFFYTLKPSSAVQINLQIEPQQSENETISRIYPGLISAVGQCILNGSLFEFNATSIIESHNETLYGLDAVFQFPDTFFNSVTNRKIVLIFNVSLSENISVYVNNFCSAEQLNSPIEQITVNGSTIEIELKYNITHVVIEWPIPARRDEND